MAFNVQTSSLSTGAFALNPMGLFGGQTGAIQGKIQSQIGSIQSLMAQLDAILAELEAIQPPGKNPDDPLGYDRALQEFLTKLNELNTKLRDVRYKMHQAQQILSRMQNQELPTAQREEQEKTKALFDAAQKRLEEAARKRREELLKKDLPANLPVVAGLVQTQIYQPDPVDLPEYKIEYEALQFQWVPAGTLEPPPTAALSGVVSGDPTDHGDRRVVRRAAAGRSRRPAGACPPGW